MKLTCTGRKVSLKEAFLQRAQTKPVSYTHLSVLPPGGLYELLFVSLKCCS